MQRAPNPAQTSALFMEVGSALVAVPLPFVVETLRPLPVRPVPDAPSAIVGIALLRGAPVPVVALGPLLGRHEAPVGRFVSLRLGTRGALLAVGTVLGVRRLAPGDLQPLPLIVPGVAEGAIASVGVADRELLVVLEAMRLVPREVWALLETSQGAPS